MEAFRKDSQNDSEDSEPEDGFVRKKLPIKVQRKNEDLEESDSDKDSKFIYQICINLTMLTLQTL